VVDSEAEKSVRSSIVGLVQQTMLRGQNVSVAAAVSSRRMMKEGMPPMGPRNAHFSSVVASDAAILLYYGRSHRRRKGEEGGRKKEEKGKSEGYIKLDPFRSAF